MLQLFSPFPPIFLPFPVPTTTAEIPKTTIESTTTTASLPETTTTLLTTIPSTTTTRKLTSTTQKSTTTTEQNNIIEGELFGPTPKTIKPIRKWTKKDKIISSHLTCSSTCEYEGDLRPLFRLYNGILGINDNMLESDPIMLKQLQMNNYVIKHSKTYIAEVEDTELCQCAVPLYRLYNELNHDHFYTTNNTEADSARDRAGYVFQNIEGYCTQYAGCGAFLPLYRFYNPFLRDHLYTTDQAEMLFFKTNLIQGYVFEKIECYLWAFEVPTKNCQHLL
uniref:Uncharacterized protein n=1 Tax=Rhabditophanes sp. KR3021 TaxID=114890 RepID=A0AC35TI94_9BILA